ncbi:hypothetical protein ACRALDRAFT_204759 [Sodiomyces alcalophilus JCM 7366]|uniref:uncharacterized protein n=1 Tax=Sodiomyces alcalophilus JCM 7366 TaxID=591952 RepID=UPI0039B6AFB4
MFTDARQYFLCVSSVSSLRSIDVSSLRSIDVSSVSSLRSIERIVGIVATINRAYPYRRDDQLNCMWKYLGTGGASGRVSPAVNIGPQSEYPIAPVGLSSP